jgi:Raf kinase inhibitor-like YbhB/YbcL family protein
MKSSTLKIATPLFLLCLSGTTFAESFTLTSKDIAHGEFMSTSQEFKGFGCNGDNLSPQLAWQNAPKGTEAFALTVYDPDAPTGSGWWHWQVVNIPKSVSSLASGAGNADKNALPKGSVQITNDYGFKGFGGACPPEGHGAHRYQFTLHALSQKLELPENASGALAGYMINAYSLDSATIEALYKR